MPKLAHDDFQDAALNVLKNNVTRQVACSSEPTTFAEANATYALADVTMATGDFTIANGDTSGRKVTMAAKSGVLIDTSGTALWCALLDVTNSKLLYRTTITSQALTANGTNTVNFPAWDVEIPDPS